MYQSLFFINYGGRGYRLAMTSEALTQEQAELLSPVPDCITIIAPAGMKIDVPALEVILNRHVEVDTSFE